MVCSITFTFAVLDAGNIWGGFFFVLAITALAGIQRCTALVADLVKHFSLPLFVAVAAEIGVLCLRLRLLLQMQLFLWMWVGLRL